MDQNLRFGGYNFDPYPHVRSKDPGKVQEVAQEIDGGHLFSLVQSSSALGYPAQRGVGGQTEETEMVPCLAECVD